MFFQVFHVVAKNLKNLFQEAVRVLAGSSVFNKAVGQNMELVSETFM